MDGQAAHSLPTAQPTPRGLCPQAPQCPLLPGFSLLIGVPTGVRGKAPHVKGPGAEAPAGAGCPGILDGWEGEPAKPGVGRRPLGRRGTPL